MKRTKEVDPKIKEQMDLFNEWFCTSLDRSFSDAVIMSVLQYHVVRAYVKSEIPIKDVVKVIKDQYKDICEQSDLPE